MESLDPKPQGGPNAITSRNEFNTPSNEDHEPASRHPQPPLTFVEARTHSPYALLHELHDQALYNYRETTPEPFLAELALSAAVVRWWTSWQPIAMERAFEAGASLEQVAAALGCAAAEVVERWSDWAGDQSQLIIGSRPSVDPDTVGKIRERLTQELNPGGQKPTP